MVVSVIYVQTTPGVPWIYVYYNDSHINTKGNIFVYNILFIFIIPSCIAICSNIYSGEQPNSKTYIIILFILPAWGVSVIYQQTTPGVKWIYIITTPT